MRKLLGLWALAACGRPAVMVPDGITHRDGLAARHVTSCTEDAQCGRDEPPAGGPHCPTALGCRIWTTPQQRCQYIHNLEHGHLVLAYNCPGGCDSVVADLTGFFNSLPSPKRALLTPDPKLTTRAAAMVWGYTWAGDQVDLGRLNALLTLQDKEAPEAGLGCNP